MKKLLAVATIGVVGYLVVKKIKERKDNEVEVNEEMKNEEVVENAEEEIVVDNDEVIEVEIVDNMEVEENNVFNKIKDLVKAPIKLVVEVCGFIGRLLLKVNKRLKNVRDIDDKDLMYMGDFEFYVRQIGLIMGGLVIDINRKVILVLADICKMMNKIL